MLPVLGPSTPRDLSGQAVDVGLDPDDVAALQTAHLWQASREYFTILDLRAQLGHFYALTRSLYRRYRDNEIHNGQTDKENLPISDTLP